MEAKKNVLLITYYWPPSGGAGVQRWLKMSKYLSALNVDITVITVDPKKGAIPVFDASLIEEVPANIRVIHTNTSEPFGIYKKLLFKSTIPSGGFSNDNQHSLSSKFARFIRGNFFIPDARKGWNKFAFKAAKVLLDEQTFDCVVITSPPHSSQLIGLKIKSLYNIPWIADMRDPWTDIYYYDKLIQTRWAKKRDLNLEKKVLNTADKVIVVSGQTKTLLAQKVDFPQKIEVIPNGYDQSDFDYSNITPRTTNDFLISYTGTISNNYPIENFIQSVEDIDSDILKVEFVGDANLELKNRAVNLPFLFKEFVPHNLSIAQLINSDSLLLVIPKVTNNANIVPGKLFEYLAAQKPIILIGPKNGDTAKIVEECNSGKCFDYTEIETMKEYISSLIKEKQSEIITFQPNKSKIELYSRESLAKRYYSIFSDL